MAVISLAQMKAGDSGIITAIRGGHGFTHRLGAQNIRQGKRITKLSSIFRGGPVMVRIDGTQLALGFGMAKRIFVEVGEQ